MQLSSFSVELNPIKPIQYTTIFGCNIVLLNQNVIYRLCIRYKTIKIENPKQNDFKPTTLFTFADYRNCETSDHKCGNGLCVPESKRCDGYFDCRDETDEAGCTGVACMLQVAYLKHCIYLYTVDAA